MKPTAPKVFFTQKQGIKFHNNFKRQYPTTESWEKNDQNHKRFPFLSGNRPIVSKETYNKAGSHAGLLSNDWMGLRSTAKSSHSCIYHQNDWIKQVYHKRTGSCAGWQAPAEIYHWDTGSHTDLIWHDPTIKQIYNWWCNYMQMYYHLTGMKGELL